jgi:hypothetical protein
MAALPFTEHNPDGRGDFFSSTVLRPPHTKLDANPWIYYSWDMERFTNLMRIQGKELPDFVKSKV